MTAEVGEGDALGETKLETHMEAEALSAAFTDKVPVMEVVVVVSTLLVPGAAEKGLAACVRDTGGEGVGRLAGAVQVLGRINGSTKLWFSFPPTGSPCHQPQPQTQRGTLRGWLGA